MPEPRILITANNTSHLVIFHQPYIRMLQSWGCRVETASDSYPDFALSDQHYNAPFRRNLFSRGNFRAFWLLVKLIRANRYDIIHCHTPSAGFLSRLAVLIAGKKDTKVLYTVHGFHFFKGAPLLNWLLFFPMEWLMSFLTDAIITINKEDEKMISQYRFGNQFTFRIPGIGIDKNRLESESSPEESRMAIRKKLGFQDDHVVLLYIAEFIPRKNHGFLIRTLPKLLKDVPNVRFLFVGRGKLLAESQRLAQELGVDKYCHFAGFHKQIGGFIEACDIGVSASKQEGLGLGVAEIMSTGKPVVVTEDRGHRELVTHEVDGILFPQGDEAAFRSGIKRFVQDPAFARTLAERGKHKMLQFTVDTVQADLERVYRIFLPK